MRLDIVAEFQIEGKAVGKARQRFVRRTGHCYTPAQTVNYQTLLHNAARPLFAGKQPSLNPFKVEIIISKVPPESWPKKKLAEVFSGELLPIGKPDVDNVSKIILDGLNGIAWRDDAQVVDLRVVRVWASSEKVTVTLGEYVSLTTRILGKITQFFKGDE